MYGIRATPQSGNHCWLSNSALLSEYIDRFELKTTDSKWRFELRVRCVPLDLHDLVSKDKATFNFYYDQVRFDYLNNSSLNVDPEVAVQLCCLELRRIFKDLSSSALDKKCSTDYLEKEIGLRNLLPDSVVNNVKAKNLKKMMQHQFKKGQPLVEPACMFKFLEILRSFYRYDRENFFCDLGVSCNLNNSTCTFFNFFLLYQASWSIPVELIIGPDVGISYTASQGAGQVFENLT